MTGNRRPDGGSRRAPRSGVRARLRRLLRPRPKPRRIADPGKPARPKAKAHRRTGLVLFFSGAAAAVLITGASGTMASWTQAIVANSANSVGTAKAVILKEVSGSATCTSSDDASNSYTCTTINKYGGTATPLAPGTSQQVDVTFTNVGSSAATSFRLAPGSCSQSPTAGSGTPAAGNLCTDGDLTVTISCSPGSSYSSGSAWTDLAYAAAAPSSTTKTHTASGGDLNVNASWTCRFTAALSSSANINAQNITVTQPLTWTLIQ